MIVECSCHIGAISSSERVSSWCPCFVAAAVDEDDGDGDNGDYFKVKSC